MAQRKETWDVFAKGKQSVFWVISHFGGIATNLQVNQFPDGRDQIIQFLKKKYFPATWEDLRQANRASLTILTFLHEFCMKCGGYVWYRARFNSWTAFLRWSVFFITSWRWNSLRLCVCWVHKMCFVANMMCTVCDVLWVGGGLDWETTRHHDAAKLRQNWGRANFPPFQLKLSAQSTLSP